MEILAVVYYNIDLAYGCKPDAKWKSFDVAIMNYPLADSPSGCSALVDIRNFSNNDDNNTNEQLAVDAMATILGAIYWTQTIPLVMARPRPGTKI